MHVTPQSIFAACAAAVDAIPIPRPVRLDRFLSDLGRRRGRPIRLVPTPLAGAAPCGMPVTSNHVDHVCNTSPLHCQHIIFHKIGHLELGHTTSPHPYPDDDLLSDLNRLMPNLSPALIRRLFSQTSHPPGQEQQS